MEPECPPVRKALVRQSTGRTRAMSTRIDAAGLPGTDAISHQDQTISGAQITRVVRVLWTTPHGRTGTDGMDRLTQVILEAVAADPDATVSVTPLTTKGRWGILVGSFVFAHAALRLLVLGLTRQVDVLHLNVAAYG